MARIKKSQTIILTSWWDITEDTYPGMTAEEALAHEENMDRLDKLEYFVEAVGDATFKDRVTDEEYHKSSLQAVYTESVSIVE